MELLARASSGKHWNLASAGSAGTAVHDGTQQTLAEAGIKLQGLTAVAPVVASGGAAADGELTEDVAAHAALTAGAVKTPDAWPPVPGSAGSCVSECFHPEFVEWSCMQNC